MKTKEEKLIEAIGDTEDSNVLRAVGHESADPTLKTEVRHMEIIDVPKPSEADIRRYRIRNGVLGGLAAAVAITGGVVLWNNLKDIQTEPKPAESSTTAVITIPTPYTVTDSLSVITDTSMPEPFETMDNNNFDNYDNPFNNQWIKRFFTIDNSKLWLPDEDKVNVFLSTYHTPETPYTLDDNMNLYVWCKEFDLDPDDLCEAIKYDNRNMWGVREDVVEQLTFTDDELDVLRSMDRQVIINTFASEYSIIVGENVFSPKWLYYHTIEDYEKVNISATQIRVMLTKYKELGLTDEAFEAFSAKLEGYIGTHKAATEDKRYIIDTENHDLTSDKAISILEDVFYGEWAVTEDYKLSFTYESSPFDFEGFHRPLCFAETEDIWYMLCINSGESEIFVIEKSDPDVMYQTGLSYFNGYDSTPVVELGSEMSIKYTREDIPADKTLPTGEISLLAEYKLFNINGEDFKTFYNETLNNGFTFEDGTHKTREMLQ